MNNTTTAATRFQSDLFDGAAWYFARYQADYPPALFRFLRENFNLEPHASVLDLGCGTGQIGVPLAESVSRVVCVDPDAAMLAEARQFAQREGADNVQFIEGHSETLPRELGPFRLTTMAGAFHWMDRPRVLQILDGLLERQGGIAITSRERENCVPGDWWNRYLRYVEDFWGGFFPAGKGGVRPQLAISNRQILASSPFSDVLEVQHHYEHRWALDDLMGYVFSTSKACPGVLGERRPAFEAGLRELLETLSPSREFIERGYTLTLAATRP